MARPSDEATLESYRTALRYALLALLLLSPLPFGSVQPWAVLALELYAAGLGLFAVLLLRRDPEALPRKARRALVPAGILVAVGILQILPAPGGWTRLVATPTAEARRQIAEVLPEVGFGLAPQSLGPAATTDALLRLVAYVLVGVATVVAIRRSDHLRQTAVVLVASGAFQAFYGSSEYLSGHQHIFGYAKKYYDDVATGTFINRNHFAEYLALTLPLALGLALEGARRFSRGDWRQRLLGLIEPAGTMVVAGAIGAALIWTGVVLSYSRGGLAAALAACAIVLLACGWRRKRAWLLAAALALPTVLLLARDVQAPGERFLAPEQELLRLGGRLPVWQATLRMVPDFLPFGSGLGTFEGAFELYRPESVRSTWEHTHNDWLQALVEGGPLVVAALVWLLWILVRRASPDSPSRPPVLILCACAAILAAAIHGFVDFGLRIPAIAVLVACLVGMVASERGIDDETTRPLLRFSPRS